MKLNEFLLESELTIYLLRRYITSNIYFNEERGPRCKRMVFTHYQLQAL